MNNALIVLAILGILFALAAYAVTRGSQTDGDMWKGAAMLFFLVCAGVCVLAETILAIVKIALR
jgi:hypothetical protein